MWLVIEREEVGVTLSRDTCSCQNGVHAVCKKPKNRRTGVRVLILAEKRGNSRGAKGRRKAKVDGKRCTGGPLNHTVNSDVIV